MPFGCSGGPVLAQTKGLGTSLAPTHPPTHPPNHPPTHPPPSNPQHLTPTTSFSSTFSTTHPPTHPPNQTGWSVVGMLSAGQPDRALLHTVPAHLIQRMIDQYESEGGKFVGGSTPGFRFQKVSHPPTHPPNPPTQRTHPPTHPPTAVESLFEREARNGKCCVWCASNRTSRLGTRRKRWVAPFERRRCANGSGR